MKVVDVKTKKALRLFVRLFVQGEISRRKNKFVFLCPGKLN